LALIFFCLGADCALPQFFFGSVLVLIRPCLDAYFGCGYALVLIVPCLGAVFDIALVPIRLCLGVYLALALP
jgi:hypothetical protein